MSNESVFFISDAHLGITLPSFEDRESALISFLRHIRPPSSLYLVGDIFDFWIEYRHAIRPAYFRILHAFANAIEAGVEIHYLAGNHDFALGPFLGRTIGLRLHADHLIIELQGKRVHLYHGDGLARGDVGYRLLRRILRNPFNQSLFKMMHPNIGVPLATFFSGSSRSLLSLRLSEKRIAEYRRRAKDYLDGGDDIVIFAHTHRPELIRWGEKTYCNTGEWIRRYSFAKLEGGIITLWDYLPSGALREIKPLDPNAGASVS